MKFIERIPLSGPSLTSYIKSTLFSDNFTAFGSTVAPNLPDLRYIFSNRFTSFFTFVRVYTTLGLSDISETSISFVKRLLPSKDILLIIGFSTTLIIRISF